MTQLRLGLAAGVALAASAPAWAEDEKAVALDPKPTSDTTSSSEGSTAATRAAVSVGTSGTANAVEVGSATPVESKDARATRDERWLREREGYRDGGY